MQCQRQRGASSRTSLAALPRVPRADLLKDEVIRLLELEAEAAAANKASFRSEQQTFAVTTDPTQRTQAAYFLLYLNESTHSHAGAAALHAELETALEQATISTPIALPEPNKVRGMGPPCGAWGHRGPP